MLQITPAIVEQPLSFEFIFLFLIKHILHDQPKAFLPLEHCLLCDYVRHNIIFKTPCIENIRQLINIIIRVVLKHCSVALVNESTFVYHHFLAIRACEHSLNLAGPH